MSTSYKGYVEKIDSNALVNNRPCDTYAVNTMLDNLRHMCDSAQCYKVNIAGVLDVVSGAHQYSFFNSLNQPGPPYHVTQVLCFNFPMLMLRENTYPCFDVIFAGSITDDSLSDLEVGIVIGHPSMPAPTGTFLLGLTPKCIGAATGTSTAAATTQTLINTQIVPASDNVDVFQQFLPITDGVSGGGATAFVAMGRAYVIMQATLPSGASFALDLLQIREYTPV